MARTKLQSHFPWTARGWENTPRDRPWRGSPEKGLQGQLYHDGFVGPTFKDGGHFSGLPNENKKDIPVGPRHYG